LLFKSCKDIEPKTLVEVTGFNTKEDTVLVIENSPHTSKDVIGFKMVTAVTGLRTVKALKGLRIVKALKGFKTFTAVIGLRIVKALKGLRIVKALKGFKTFTAVIGLRIVKALKGFKTVKALKGLRTFTAVIGLRIVKAVIGLRTVTFKDDNKLLTEILVTGLRTVKALKGLRTFTAVIGFNTVTSKEDNRLLTTMLVTGLLIVTVVTGFNIVAERSVDQLVILTFKEEVEVVTVTLLPSISAKETVSCCGSKSWVRTLNAFNPFPASSTSANLLELPSLISIELMFNSAALIETVKSSKLVM